MNRFSHLYNKEYYGDLLTENHLASKKLGWSVMPDATVLPHRNVGGELGCGLLDRNGSYIDGSGLHRGLCCGYDVSREEVDAFDEDVVFLGLWPRVWGHCLTDNIRRLWVLQDDDFMERYGGLRFVYVAMDGMMPGQNFLDLLEILGAGKIRLEAIDRISRFRNVILPEECFFREDDGTRMFTAEYVAMIDRIRAYGEAHFTKTGDRKLYFTYRNFEAQRSIGETKLERFFAALGYRIVSPEQYTFPEQLNMLLNCDAFASTIGSCAHNCIFLRDGATVHLIPRAGFISEYQFALDQVHDLDITYADSSLSVYADPERPWEGPFYYFISRQLQECFGQHCGYKARRFDFMVYRNLACAMHGPSAPADYYKGVLKEYIPVDPGQKTQNTILVRLIRKPRIRRFIAKWLG